LTFAKERELDYILWEQFQTPFGEGGKTQRTVFMCTTGGEGRVSTWFSVRGGNENRFRSKEGRAFLWGFTLSLGKEKKREKKNPNPFGIYI